MINIFNGDAIQQGAQLLFTSQLCNCIEIEFHGIKMFY